mmetsp:Transcript_28743/g.42460  ORF Transcript_28743/g.42460 Transcript_28743/m.42460 type:complete len:239 (-) Transcript_28743:44-760(-)
MLEQFRGAYLVLIILVIQTYSLPYSLISSGKERCVTIVAPQSTKLRIEYESPDIDAFRSEENKIWISVNAKVTKPGSVNNAQDWNDHFKRNFNVKSQNSVKELITNSKGSISYVTEENGEVEVCLKATKASSQNALRFALSVMKENEIHVHDVNVDETNTDRHLSHMEMEIEHLLSSMKNIIAEADLSKQRETRFHQQTLSMHAASMWWPIVQLCVLFLTGFTQANHVVKFLKGKRLI